MLTIAILVVAVTARQPSLFIIGTVLLVTAGVSRLWERYCLTRVEYTRTILPSRAFAGETVELRVRIVNRKPLPLAWLEVEDEVPAAVHFPPGTARASHKTGRAILRRMLALRWYESVTHTYRFTVQARGYFAFGPLTLRSGDLFGFFTTDRQVLDEQYLIVYPAVLPVEALGLPPRFLMGEVSQKRALIRDPLRVVGVREYAPGDTLRQVHWRATARMPTLQVKQLESSTSLDLLLFLNVSTTVPDWFGVAPELLEQAVTVTASLADHALNAGYRVGLYANTNLPRSDQQVKLAAASDAAHRQRVLEALAQVGGLSTVAMDSFLQRETRNLAWGATIVVVTAVAPEGLLAGLTRLRRAGRQVALVQVGDGELASVPGIPVYRATAGEARGAVRLA